MGRSGRKGQPLLQGGEDAAAGFYVSAIFLCTFTFSSLAPPEIPLLYILDFRAPLSLEKSAASSVVKSAEISCTTRRIDLAADLREAMERNAREAREGREAARLKKTEADKAEAAALKKLAEAEAADAEKKRAEEAAHR